MVYLKGKKKIARFWGECMNLYKLPKAELIVECERLQDELNRLNDCYAEMENQYADAINILNSSNEIKNLEWFMFKLDIEGLMTPQLKSFIEEYLKFYNERK